MRIAHVCLSNFYIDGRSYQENELVRQHVQDGHDVLVVASTETHSETGQLCYTNPARYAGEDGAPVIRLPYRRVLPHKVMTKLRMHPGVYATLQEFEPETILFHGTCGWELTTCARYVRRNRHVLLYVDSHEDWNNSARNFVSREILHRLYYGPVLRAALPAVEKILCVSTESIDFVADLYRIPRERLEFFPLGGHPVEDSEYYVRRSRTRSEYGIAEGEILILQSGKQTRRKKLIASLQAFVACSEPSLRFVIVGLLSAEVEKQAKELISSDSRISYLGWQSPNRLTDLLCAADVYLQPGTQSATMQHSLCCRCAVILDDVPAHHVYACGNGWLINEKLAISDILGKVRDADLTAMANASYAFAREALDYRKLSLRILQ